MVCNIGGKGGEEEGKGERRYSSGPLLEEVLLFSCGCYMGFFASWCLSFSEFKELVPVTVFCLCSFLH